MAGAAGSAGAASLSSAGHDLLLIAVPDGVLAEVAARLAARPQAAVALHTSGSRGAAVLAPLRAAGSLPGALHPLKAFPRALDDPAEARGVFFGLDGDEAALRLARRLVDAWGGLAGEVPERDRPIYHFAATLAAGGVATLLATAADLARRAGLPPAVARGYLELARGTVAEAAAAGAEMPAPAGAGWALPPGAAPEGAVAALTGPVARGDLETFALHLRALSAAAPERVPLALALARETLREYRRHRRQPMTSGASGAAGGAGHRELEAWIDALTI